MGLTIVYNPLANMNAQPEFQQLYEPFQVDPASTGAVTFPAAAGAGAWVPGALLTFNTAGVGSYPPAGFNSTVNGDQGNSGNPTFPYNWTVPSVDLSPTTSTVYLAGILLGVGALGQAAPGVPDTGGPNSSQLTQLVAMVGKRGMMQVLVDNTTTIGHTIIPSTTSGHTGQCSDSGGTTRTYGTCVGVAMQAVTVSAGPLLCWVNVNIP